MIQVDQNRSQQGRYLIGLIAREWKRLQQDGRRREVCGFVQRSSDEERWRRESHQSIDAENEKHCRGRQKSWSAVSERRVATGTDAAIR